MKQFQLNKKIEQLIREKDYHKQFFTESDKDLICQYEGNGGLASQGAKGTGLLYEFFTPQYICNLMFQLAIHHGFNGGNVLEPSIATGRMINNFVINQFENDTKIVGFEINQFSKRITEILYPKVKVYLKHFETAFLEEFRQRDVYRAKNKPTWLKDYPFSLLIGNPPYGVFSGRYKSFFTKDKIRQVEHFFIYYGLKLLKKGGLLIYLIPSNFIQNGLFYAKTKQKIFDLGELVDAYRLPSVFKTSEIPTDIIILRKK